MSADKRIIITTTQDVPGKKIESILGPVFAIATIGGVSSGSKPTEVPFDVLKNKAIELEADAIIGLTQSTSIHDGRNNPGVTTFLGTAVKLTNG